MIQYETIRKIQWMKYYIFLKYLARIMDANDIEG